MWAAIWRAFNFSSDESERPPDPNDLSPANPDLFAAAPSLPAASHDHDATSSVRSSVGPVGTAPSQQYRPAQQPLSHLQPIPYQPPLQLRVPHPQAALNVPQQPMPQAQLAPYRPSQQPSTISSSSSRQCVSTESPSVDSSPISLSTYNSQTEPAGALSVSASPSVSFSEGTPPTEEKTPSSASEASDSPTTQKKHDALIEIDASHWIMRILPKSNSTSTIFATGSLASPDVNEVLLSVAMVLQMQMLQDLESGKERKESFKEFDDDIWYIRHAQKEKERQQARQNNKGESAHCEEEPDPKKLKRELPCLEYIFKFIKALYECGELTPECNIIALVLVNRLLAFTGVPLLVCNWRPIYVTALLISQKIWDDRCLANSQFAKIIPMFTVGEITNLETRFLDLIKYDVHIPSRLYAKYYFELRAIAEEQDRIWKLKPLSEKDALRLAASNFNRTRKKRTQGPKPPQRRTSHEMYKPKGPNTILA